MIKKIFKSFFILWLIWIWLINSFVRAYQDNCDNWDRVSLGWWIHPVWSVYQSSNSSSFNLWFLNKGTVLTQSLWFWKKVFSPEDNVLFWWNTSWMPYMYFKWLYQWIPNNYYVCDEITWWTVQRVYNCSRNNLTIDSLSILSSFFSTINSSVDYWWYYTKEDTYHRYFNVCVSSSELWHSLCFVFYTCTYNSSCPSSNCLLHDWQGYTNLTFSSIPDSIIWDSPWLSSWWWDWWDPWDIEIWDWWIWLFSDQSAINYFEKNYWRDERICYVWVDNYTDLYWTRVSFEEWSWLNIFQVFSWLYWNTDLNKVYVWLNSRLINYNQWSVRMSDWLSPLYLASYNSWTNKVNIYYDDLTTSPFINNPVAVYFMANYIYDRSPSYSMWSEVVSYCNLKINWWSFEEIIDESVKNNITNYTEQSNINVWLNSDWTSKEIDRYTVLVWTWDFWSGFDVSWEILQYSWDIDLKWFFDNAINEMQSVIGDVNNPLTWVLPQYIIFALLLVILFKILKK